MTAQPNTIKFFSLQRGAMFSRILAVAIAAPILLALGCAQTKSAPETKPSLSETVEVKVIAFNDFHGNLRTPGLRIPVPDDAAPNGLRLESAGGVEQFAAVVKSLRAKNPNNVVISSGDLIGATPLVSALFNDEPTIEAMNLIGIDYNTVGNHEFDYGVAHLKRMRNGGCAIDAKTKVADCGGRPPFAGAKFEFLSANVVVNDTQRTLFPAYGIKEFGGVRVAFIGAVVKDTPAIVRPGGTAGLTFLDEVEAINRTVAELKKNGVEAFVVSLHEGANQDGAINECKNFKGRAKDIAEALDPAVSVVLTAHTHRWYVCPDIQGKLVTSGAALGTLVTEVDLTLDRATKKIVAKRAQNIIVRPDGPKEPALTELVTRYTALAAPKENRVVAHLKTELTAVTNAAGESTLGNLIADAHLAATRSPDQGGAVIAFNNPGSLRAPLVGAGRANGGGSVTYGQLFRAQPFQNDLIVMTLTGKQIKALLEQQWTPGPVAERPRLLGVSTGFSFTWDAAKPIGERVIADSMRLNGVPIRPDLQYRVVANSFVAGGSEGLTVFAEGTERQTSVLDLEALVQFLSERTEAAPYDAPALGKRIARVN
jgi:5'-nucleotidase